VVAVGAELNRARVDASDICVVVSQYGEGTLVSRTPDGSGVFEIPCANVDTFVHWLLRFVDRAEVLEPAPLRAHVVNWLESRGRYMSRRGPRPVNERLRRLLVMLPWSMERGSVSTEEMADFLSR
jgi:predicted DNA-binding transcriptional regulator YafY